MAWTSNLMSRQRFIMGQYIFETQLTLGPFLLLNMPELGIERRNLVFSFLLRKIENSKIL